MGETEGILLLYVSADLSSEELEAADVLDGILFFVKHFCSICGFGQEL